MRLAHRLPRLVVSAKCRSCGAEIVWAQTKQGKKMPVDAAAHPDGTLKVTAERDGTLVVEVRAPEGTQPRYRPHFSTCPDAESWRQR